MLNFEKIQRITGGIWITEPENEHKVLKGGAFDSRDLRNADIFFAWKGEHSDGHQYTSQLEGSDIKLIIVERLVEAVPGIAILKVADSLEALHQMAGSLASEFDGKIISITGSSGKTTTKTWLGHVLSKKFKILKNPGSFNNHIGCPITILSLEPEYEVLLLEMGTSGMGELELLSSIAPADYTVLLNVGHAHLGKFGSLENTKKAKLEIFRYQRKDAVSYLPAFDASLKLPEGKQDCRFGKDAEDFSWKWESLDIKTGTQKFTYKLPDGNQETIVIPALGPHVGDTFSFIFSLASKMGMSWEEMADSVSDLPVEKGRMVFEKGIQGELILDDTYNANPESLVNMLKALSSFSSKKKIAVVGNLAELEKGLKASSEIILTGLPDNLTHILMTGETSEKLAPEIQRKYTKMSVTYFEMIDDLLPFLLSLVDEDTTVGVKGSRSSHMERIVKVLRGDRSNCWLQQCGKMMNCVDCSEF